MIYSKFSDFCSSKPEHSCLKIVFWINQAGLKQWFLAKLKHELGSSSIKAKELSLFKVLMQKIEKTAQRCYFHPRQALPIPCEKLVYIFWWEYKRMLDSYYQWKEAFGGGNLGIVDRLLQFKSNNCCINLQNHPKRSA